jgi:hypothetical protein
MRNFKTDASGWDSEKRGGARRFFFGTDNELRSLIAILLRSLKNWSAETFSKPSAIRREQPAEDVPSFQP